MSGPAASGPSPDWRLGRIVEQPPPTVRPAYTHPPVKASQLRTWSLEDALDGVFFVVGAVLTLWLGWLIIVKELRFSGYTVGYLVVFWLLLAYVGLPRLQELLTKVYVPDYFIGRTVTANGVLGDPVNLAADGKAAAIHAVMTRAGWTRADEVTLRSSWGIVVSSVLRRSYAAAPVSPLFLFGRQQAFAYEQEVDGNASQRHHVRFWPVPDGWVLPGGYRVGWLAAATYDRAVGLSLFTLQVTHKIDADVDIERDYVVDTVRFADPAVPLRVIDNFSTAFHTRNGGGDVVHSDGALAVLDLAGITTPAPAPQSEAVPGHDPLSHRLPPPGLLLSGLLSVAKAGFTLVGVVLSLLGVAVDRDVVSSPGELTVVGLGAALILVLWVLTLSRRRWARLMLMATCTASAVVQLATIRAADRITFAALLSAGVSLLILIAVSSTDAGRWVRREV